MLLGGGGGGGEEGNVLWLVGWGTSLGAAVVVGRVGDMVGWGWDGWLEDLPGGG